jgi:hypothetical protein
MRLILHPLAALAMTAALAGCEAREPAKPTEPAPPVAAAPPPSTPAPTPAQETTGGDGSPILLNPLTAAEITDAKLGGELGCTFATGGTAAPLLVAMGDVGSKDAAMGVVKVAGYVERVATPGGFDAMLKGATFSGQGKTLVLALTGPATGGGESPPTPATLTYQRADGASRTFVGQWTCGP